MYCRLSVADRIMAISSVFVLQAKQLVLMTLMVSLRFLFGRDNRGLHAAGREPVAPALHPLGTATERRSLTRLAALRGAPVLKLHH